MGRFRDKIRRKRLGLKVEAPIQEAPKVIEQVLEVEEEVLEEKPKKATKKKANKKGLWKKTLDSGKK